MIGNYDHAGPQQSAADRQSQQDNNGKPAEDDRHEPGTLPRVRMIVLHERCFRARQVENQTVEALGEAGTLDRHFVQAEPVRIDLLDHLAQRLRPRRLDQVRIGP